jgi:hypothetical protein
MRFDQPSLQYQSSKAQRSAARNRLRTRENSASSSSARAVPGAALRQAMPGSQSS